MVTEDEALKRGSDAGWSLAKALAELCADKTEVAILAAIAAMSIFISQTADAHCYRVWRFHAPQHCGIELRLAPPVRYIVRRPHAQIVARVAPAPVRAQANCAPVTLVSRPIPVLTGPSDDDLRASALDQLRLDLAFKAVGGKR